MDSIELDFEHDEVMEAFKLYIIASAFKYDIQHVHQTISETALAQANSLAVTDANKNLTFAELEQLSDKVAAYLNLLRFYNESTIAVFLKESVLLPVSILGILKAGCTYVPLSTDYPAARIAAIFKDADIKAVFTDQGNSAIFEGITDTVIELDNDLVSLPSLTFDSSFNVTADNDAAYILYTSGSTGEPKGVVVEHGSLANYLHWYLEDLQSITNVNLPLTSSICFAAAITQMFSPLMIGQPLHIVDRSIVKDPARLLSWYGAHPGYGLYCVPTLWEEIVNYVELNGSAEFGRPDCIYLSGESLSKRLVNRTFDIWPDMEFWNLYGPTEATANISIYKVNKDSEVYLGTCIRGGKILLLDENLNHVPNGEEGMIYISSRALARGYLNKPELNQKNFIRNHNIPGFEDVTIYNTGDIGRYNEKNELLYLGRRDQQVKVRGYRIELSEIEKSLNTVPGIRQAACKVIPDQFGNNRIIAFVVARDRSIDVKHIKTHLSLTLPLYMLPELFSFLDDMPKLGNSKIDRSKLTYDTELLNESSFEGQQATNDEERALLSIWATVLDKGSVAMDDDFFDIGGNSLKVIRMLSLIKKQFNCTLTFNDIWDNPTPTALITLLSKPDVKEADSDTLVALPFKSTVPPSFSQSGLWFIAQSLPQQTAYNIAFSIKLQGDIDRGTVEIALQNVLVKHDALRSNFLVVDKSPARQIDEQSVPELLYEDLSALSSQEKEGYKAKYLQEAFTRRFNLENNRLINFNLVKYSDDEQELFVAVHHIVFDGLSIKIFVSDFVQNCNAANSRTIQNSNPAVNYTCADYDQWFKKRYFNGALSSSYDFWKSKLEGANYFLNFPTDKLRPKIQSFSGKTHTLHISKDSLHNIKEFGKSHKTSPFVVLLSVFEALIHRYTGEQDILIGVPFANRPLNETQDIIGYFVNTLVYRTVFSKEMTFTHLLKYLRQYTLDAVSHQHYPFEKLVEKLNPERSVSYNPVFQVMFAYHDALGHHTTTNGVKVTAEEFQNPNCKFDIDAEAQEHEDGITLNFNYNSDLFNDSTIAGFARHFDYLLNAVLEQPTLPVTAYALEDRLALINKTAQRNALTASVEPCCIHEVLQRTAVQFADEIALSATEGNLTYRELNQRSNQLARSLQTQNVGSGNIVAVMTGRSLDMVVALFGILKAGAVYLPIAPEYPADRIQYMLQDSGADVLLHDGTCNSITDFSIPAFMLGDASFYENQPSHNLNARATPTDLAYVIYTSGSTGKPKGVMVEHHSVINRIAWMLTAYPLNAGDAVLQKTTFTFDVSVWELFMPCFYGGRLHLLNAGGEKDPGQIIETIRQESITAMHFVPSMFTTFLDFLGNKPAQSLELASLKYVFASGEALEQYHIEKFNKLIASWGNAMLINLYGPTEATVDVSHFDCADAASYKNVPIGKPIANTQLYIIDQHQNLLPDNIPGELCIAGVGLARGYLNNDTLTGEKFIYSNWDHTRLYKTGDLARMLPDGNIDYIGRIDQQVKIRGFRIELNEIDRCIADHPGIEASATLIKKFGYGDNRIVSYIKLKDRQADADLKKHVRQFLPDYMVPSLFIKVNDMPLTGSGKLDTSALPDPMKTVEKASGPRIYNNNYEKQLADIWKEVLKTDDFGLEDNFYDAGGHSLLLINMKQQIDAAFSLDMAIVDLFQYPTIKMLADIIASASNAKMRQAIAGRAAMQKQAILNHKKR